MAKMAPFITASCQFQPRAMSGPSASQAHYVPQQQQLYAEGVVLSVQRPPAAPPAAPPTYQDNLVLRFFHQSANCCQQPGARQFWECAFALRLSIVYQQCWCMHVPVCLRSNIPRELRLYERVLLRHLQPPTLCQRWVIFDRQYDKPQGTWLPHYKYPVPGEPPILSGPARQASDKRKRRETREVKVSDKIKCCQAPADVPLAWQL